MPAFALPALPAVTIILSMLALIVVACGSLAHLRGLRGDRMGKARRRYSEGLVAGQVDRNREWKPGQTLYVECPYPEGTDDHFIWFEGYIDASHLVVPSLPVADPAAT